MPWSTQVSCPCTLEVKCYFHPDNDCNITEMCLHFRADQTSQFTINSDYPKDKTTIRPPFYLVLSRRVPGYQADSAEEPQEPVTNNEPLYLENNKFMELVMPGDGLTWERKLV